MAHVLPFRALRFASLDEISRRLVPDAGALGDQGRRRLADQDPLQVARLYDAADPWAALTRWQQEGHVVSEAPALYLVETQPTDRLLRLPPVRFLLGAMRADAELRELETGPSRIATPPLEPIPVLAADDHQVIRTLFQDVIADNFPVWESFVGDQRVRLWRLGTGGVGKRVRAALDEVPLRPHGRVPEGGSFLAAVVPLSDPGLRMVPYHRGIRGLPTFSAERFLALVKDYARLYELEVPLGEPEGIDRAREQLATLSAGRHAVLLTLPGGTGHILRFRQGMELDHIPAVPRSPTLRSLDLALLNALVLRTVLGIKDPEAPAHPNVYPVDSLRELVEKVNAGTFQFGFALNPPPVWELRAVMEAAQSLPPRTLRVSPVPPAGLLFLDPRER